MANQQATQKQLPPAEPNAQQASPNITPQVLAYISNAKGQKVALDAPNFGQYVHDHYASLMFFWRDDFINYYDSHNMQEVRKNLIAGMDNVSAAYVAHHDLLLNLTRAQEALLFKKDIEWTEMDRRLFLNYQQLKQSGKFPFLSKVNTDWGSSFTNMYGLYDADHLVPGCLGKVNGKVVIDGGGFIGDTLFLWRNIFPQSKIHTFEPSANSFKYLTNLVSKDIEQGNIIAHQKGLGDKPSKLKLSKYSPKQNVMDAGASLKIVQNDYDNAEEVDVITLDSYVEEQKLEVGFIKLDVEGFEPEIIKGALNTIKTQRPLLAIACYHTAEEFYELKGFLESLNLNYRFELRRSSLTLPLCDLVLLAIPL